jgi:hypothetical protein
MLSRISIRTRLSSEQAADVLHELIRPEGFLGGLAYASSDPRPFIGRTKGSHFKFRRRINWHNSFLPVVVGNVRPLADGAQFEALIRPDLLVAAIVPFLFAVIGIEAVRELRQYLQTSGDGGGYALFVFLTLFGGFGIVSYRFESRKVERILREAFERKGGVFPDAPNS